MSSRVMPYRPARIWLTSNWVGWKRPPTASIHWPEKGPVPPAALDPIGVRVIDSTPQAIPRS